MHLQPLTEMMYCYAMSLNTKKEMIVLSEPYIIYLYLDSENRVEGWGSTYSPGTVPFEVTNDHPFFTQPGVYKYVDGELIRDHEYELYLGKITKTNELIQACKEDILNGFKYDNQFYGFSEEDQRYLLFKMMYLQLVDTPPSSITWKNKDGIPVTLTITDFEDLFITAEETKEQKYQKLENLKSQVQLAETLSEVNAIKWDET